MHEDEREADEVDHLLEEDELIDVGFRRSGAPEILYYLAFYVGPR